MPSTNTSRAAAANGTAPTYTAPSSYAPSTTSSTKSTSSTLKKHLVSVFTKKLNLSSAPVPTTRGPSGKDGLTTEERRARNEARASYYSTLG